MMTAQAWPPKSFWGFDLYWSYKLREDDLFSNHVFFTVVDGREVDYTYLAAHKMDEYKHKCIDKDEALERWEVTRPGIERRLGG